jgi:hypothetical protein
MVRFDIVETPDLKMKKPSGEGYSHWAISDLTIAGYPRRSEPR